MSLDAMEMEAVGAALAAEFVVGGRPRLRLPSHACTLCGHREPYELASFDTRSVEGIGAGRLNAERLMRVLAGLGLRIVREPSR